jgi:DNA helicase II / ATP-dependent DNA helicase PcrA
MKPSIDFKNALNPEQLAAVEHGDGPLLVIAGAGSGKTRVITYRIAWLIHEKGVAPNAIVALTFTNKAAAEMRERLEELLARHPLETFVGTFHRFALRLLRTHAAKVGLPQDFAILDASDQLKIVKEALRAAYISEDNLRPQAVLGAISKAKNRLITPTVYERTADDFFSRQVAKVYVHYQANLRSKGAVDFDDMLLLSVELLRANERVRTRERERVRYLLVDEFQDTNQVQLALIHELIGDSGRLMVVGDEDQSIYRWRGAEIENILGFEKNFADAGTKKLERNYRSTQNILDASGAVVARNSLRRGKRLWTEAGAGEKILLFYGRDEQEEARFITNALVGVQNKVAANEMAVLLRTNAQTRAFEEEFMRRGLAYSLIAGVRFYERAEIKDLLAFLRLLRRPDDALSLSRVLNVPPRGIGRTTQEGLERLATQSGRGVWQTLQDERALDLTFPARAANALRDFRNLIAGLRQEAEILPLPALLHLVLERTKYLQMLKPTDPEDQARRENLDELLTAAKEFTETRTFGQDDDVLGAFLDHASLASDTDTLGGPGITVMTLHAAKGLEFEVVAIAGLEEGLLPHFNAARVAEDIEEERRLFYVGMTRAKSRLIISSCRRRRVAGNWQDQEPSRFLDELPSAYLKTESSASLYGATPSFSDSRSNTVNSFFGRAQLDNIEAVTPEVEEVRPEPPRFRQSTNFGIETSGGAIKRGSRVRHQKLGLGKVMTIEGSGDDARLEIFFEGVGRRKMVAKFANLEVL